MMLIKQEIAVMQPYIFPYFGYYKLISKVDVFIIYDNVQYIKRGYINRNRILINGQPKYFNFQIKNEDQFKTINEVRLRDFLNSRDVFLKQIFFSYRRAKYFEEVYNFIENLLDFNYILINALNTKTLIELSKKLQLKARFVNMSDIKLNKFTIQNKEEKLDTIIKLFDASSILMPPNSLQLYKDWKPVNDCKKITLDLTEISYKQFSNEFVPNLSIIDVLMFNGFEHTSSLLQNK
jgi:hypothetical protein